MMKRILWLLYILLTLAPLAFSQNGFSAHVAVTYDHTQVPNTDQTNFPVAVVTTQTAFKTTGNGGKATSSSGFDIIPYSDVGCTSILTFEWVTQSYGASTGAIEMHVVIGTVSHTADGTFYLCVGKSSITTNQSSLTWSGYSLVDHLSDTGASGTFNDSSSQGNSMSGIFGGMSDGAGVMGRGAVGSGTGGISKTSPTGLPTGNGARSASVWFKFSSTSGNQALLGFGTNASTQRFMLGWSGTFLSLQNDIGGTGWGTTTCCNDTTTWHQFVWTFPASGNLNQSVLYVDGALNSNPGSPSSSVNTVIGGLMSSQLCCGGASSFAFTGTLDELRITSAVLTADWIATEYNNQKSSSTFLTFGSVVNNGYMMPFVADVELPIWTPRILFPLLVQR